MKIDALSKLYKWNRPYIQATAPNYFTWSGKSDLAKQSCLKLSRKLIALSHTTQKQLYIGGLNNSKPMSPLTYRTNTSTPEVVTPTSSILLPTKSQYQKRWTAFNSKIKKQYHTTRWYTPYSIQKSKYFPNRSNNQTIPECLRIKVNPS